MSPGTRFQPPLWATLATPLAIAAFVALGTWQLRRGDEKVALRAALTDATAPAVPLSAALRAQASPRRVAAGGTYRADLTLLHDGPPHAGRPGRRVWTVLELDDGARALVERGWLPAEAAAPPPPAGRVQLEGSWRALPEPGLRLAASNACPPRPALPATVLYPTHAQLECILGAPVLAGLLLPSGAAEAGLVRDAWVGGVPPARHYAYAANWYAFAALTATLYFVLNLKRNP